MEKLESSYARVQLFVKKNEEEKFEHIVYVKHEPGEFIYLLDVMDSVYEKVITNQPIRKVL